MGRREIPAEVWWGSPAERDHSKSLEVYKIKFRLIEKEWESVDWINLALDRGKWRNLVNPLIELQVT
jgi:hypothetical protein